MKTLTIPKSKVKKIQREINNSTNTKYTNCLHGLLLSASYGMTCPKIAKHLGKSRTSTFLWIRKFNEEGLTALQDKKRSGRPPRLSQEQLEKVKSVLMNAPSKVGINKVLWDGKTLSEYIKNTFDVTLKVRQCQNLFHKLGFRLRKPRPMVAHSNELKRTKFKKTLKI